MTRKKPDTTLPADCRATSAGDLATSDKAAANEASWTAIPDHGTASGAAREPFKDGATPVVARRSRFAAAEEAARNGVMPEPPDFRAGTHMRFRPKLAKLVALAAAGDLEGLRAFEINPVSSSPKALDRYRNLCVAALEARAGRA